MAQKAPGKHYRKGLSWLQITNLFPNEDVAEQWFAQTRWPDGPVCPHCNSDNVQSGAAHKTMPYRCRTCRKRFLCQSGDGVGKLPSRSSHLGHCDLYSHDRTQGYVQYETPSGFRCDTEIRVVLGSPDS